MSNETKHLCKDNTVLSIIVPAYNVETYIAQCLDSLVSQTADGFRIIIVDDGSRDATGSICREYADAYPAAVQYVFQENKGLGAARNTGLALADTPYVCFLDSDDWQDIRFVEKLLRLLDRLDYEPDMIFTLPHCYDTATRLVLDWMDKPVHQMIFGGQERNGSEPVNCSGCPALYMLEVNANRKVYRTGFLQEQKFFFPEGVKWEDIRPHVQLLHEAKYCVGLSGTGFVYRINSGGQITGERGAGRLDMIPVLNDTIEYVRAHDYAKEEQAYIMHLICKYAAWTIDMTGTDFIRDLLEGFHGIFIGIPPELERSFSDADFFDACEKNRYLGMIDCLKRERYMQLANYEERDNMMRYWSTHGARKSNVISGGIQCIKDSGIRYTLGLMFRKLLKREVW